MVWLARRGHVGMRQLFHAGTTYRSILARAFTPRTSSELGPRNLGLRSDSDSVADAWHVPTRTHHHAIAARVDRRRLLVEEPPAWTLTRRDSGGIKLGNRDPGRARRNDDPRCVSDVGASREREL